MKESKLDALKLLEEGCKTFELNIYLSHAEILIEVQKEIFTTKDKDVEMASLTAFTAIISALSKSPESSFKANIHNILDTIQGNLVPEAKLFATSMKVILCLINASALSSSLVSKQIVPLLINTYNITNVSSKKAIILNRLALMMATSMSSTDNITAEIKTIPVLCLTAAQHESKEVRCCALKSLALLANHLDKSTRTILYNNFVMLLLTNIPTEEEVDNLFDCFKSLAENYPEEIEIDVLNRIVPTRVAEVEKYLVIHTKLLHIKYFYDHSLQKLLDACVGKFDRNCKIAEQDDIIDISKFALNVISKTDEFKTYKSAYADNFVDLVVLWSLENNLINVADQSYCENINYVLYNICEHEDQVELRNILYKIIANYAKTKNASLVVLFNGLICKGKSDDSLIDNDIVKIVADISLSTNSEYLQELSAKLLGNILNKSHGTFVLRCLC